MRTSGAKKSPRTGWGAGARFLPEIFLGQDGGPHPLLMSGSSPRTPRRSEERSSGAGAARTVARGSCGFIVQRGTVRSRTMSNSKCRKGPYLALAGARPRDSYEFVSIFVGNHENVRALEGAAWRPTARLSEPAARVQIPLRRRAERRFRYFCRPRRPFLRLRRPACMAWNGAHERAAARWRARGCWSFPCTDRAQVRPDQGEHTS